MMQMIEIFEALPSEIPHLAPPPAAFLRDCAIVEARMLREAPIFAAKAEELRHIPDHMLTPPPAAFLRDCAIVEARMLREAPLFAARAKELRHIPDYMLEPPPDRMSREAPIVAAAHAEFLRHVEGRRAREAETAAFAERRRASRRALREIFRAAAAIIAPGAEA